MSKCLICSREDAKAINLELLQRTSNRSGSVIALAKRLGCNRTTIWRHKKFHLKIFTSQKPVETAPLSFEERARLLAAEADRLQCMLEYGASKDLAEQGLKALALRVRLLEIEAKFANRPLTQQRLPQSLEDPQEEARALQEFHEVVGAE